ncbi:MAG: flavin monoamine oxidase family protein [Prochlorotrichaceae cyanobacterium]|jgi:monoamine oxidase
MNRRQWLFYGILSFHAAVLSAAASCRSDRAAVEPKGFSSPLMTSTFPVIILGAGMAGLAAAQTLTAAGVSVVVLEARDRLGGRIVTDRTWGIPLDLGAAWVHGSDNNPLMRLVKQSQSSPFATEDDSVVVYNHRGKPIADRLLDDGEEQYENLLDDVLDLAEARGKDMSIMDALMELDPEILDDPLMVYQLSAYLEFDLGGAIENLSARYWDSDEVFDGEDVLLREGFDRLVTTLAQGVDVRFEQIVTQVQLTDTGVTIVTDQGEWQAERVICTLPLGVLQAGDVQFTPTLPKAITNGWQAVRVGRVNKVFLEFAEPFWDKQTHYFGYFAPEKGQYPYFLNLYPLYQFPGLVTFAVGTYAQTMEQQSDETIVAEILEHLETMFGQSIPTPRRVEITRWGSDRFAKGSYSYIAVGAKPKDFKQMGFPVDDRLFFAGEHTNVDYRGTAHGAYLSGVEAAEAVLELRVK